MCGRASLSAPPEDLREVFGLDELPSLEAHYNIAPTQPIAVIRAGKHRRLEHARFGLLPPGALSSDAERAPRAIINARVESLKDRALFRAALRFRRCLVVVDGFYEWKRGATAKQPFVIQRADRRPFALAGLYDEARTGDGEIVLSCAVITTDAKPPLRDLHDRVPLVVAADDYALWLDPEVRDVEPLAPVLRGAKLVDLEARPVSSRVNSPANDDASCLDARDAFPTSDGRQGVLL